MLGVHSSSTQKYIRRIQIGCILVLSYSGVHSSSAVFVMLLCWCGDCWTFERLWSGHARNPTRWLSKRCAILYRVHTLSFKPPQRYSCECGACLLAGRVSSLHFFKRGKPHQRKEKTLLCEILRDRRWILLTTHPSLSYAGETGRRCPLWLVVVYGSLSAQEKCNFLWYFVLAS